MKLEILNKLIALANNNPNEHEANTAARRVCKAIIEDKFVISGGPVTNTTVPPKTSPKQQQSNPYDAYRYDPFEDIFGGFGGFGGFRDRYTEEAKQAKQQKQEPPKQEKTQDQVEREVVRKREQTWKYEYYNPSTSSYYNPMMQKEFSNTFQEHWKYVFGVRHHSDNARANSQRNYGVPPNEKPPSSGPNPYSGAQEEFYGFKGRKYGKESRRLRCKTCGFVKNTKFMGLESLFECNDCQWDFAKKQKEATKSKETTRLCQHCKTPVSCLGSNVCQNRNVAI